MKMKARFKRCDLTTEAGIKAAETLHQRGWKIIQSTPFHLMFEKEVVRR
jgi:hypothetical protein